jgi:hypothetical protein
MTCISCRCGAVQIRFTSHQPRVSTECCCDHCFARVRYLEDLGGPSLPSNKYQQPIVSTKWDNLFVVEKGRDQLFAYKLTPDTKVTNVASKCCSTFLLGRHSGYDANCVTTCDAFPIFTNDYARIPPSSRWYTNQWNPTRLAKLEPLTGMWVVCNDTDGTFSITGDTGWQEVLEAHQNAMGADIIVPPPLDGDGEARCWESFDQLLNSIGRAETVPIVSSSKEDAAAATETETENDANLCSDCDREEFYSCCSCQKKECVTCKPPSDCNICGGSFAACCYCPEQRVCYKCRVETDECAFCGYVQLPYHKPCMRTCDSMCIVFCQSCYDNRKEICEMCEKCSRCGDLEQCGNCGTSLCKGDEACNQGRNLYYCKECEGYTCQECQNYEPCHNRCTEEEEE